MQPQTDFVAALDNGGETFDRYTLFFETHTEDECIPFVYGASENPYYAQGFGQYVGDYSYGDGTGYEHIGEEAELNDLPEDVQKLVAQLCRDEEEVTT